MQQRVVAPDVIQKRNEWKKEITKTDADKLVFLDKSGVNIDMTRHYGRAIAKGRVADHTPENTPISTTILSSIRSVGSTAYITYQGTHGRSESCLCGFTSPNFSLSGTL